jgi:hypothetical protein
MAQVIVRIIELVICIGLGGAALAMFALVPIFIMHGLHTVGRH